MLLRMWTLVAAAFLLLPVNAHAGGCTNCFAVAIIPDTQGYVEEESQPAGAAHLDLITRFLCSNKGTWLEPHTEKRMPIQMVLHLGDIVQSGRDEGEWQRASAAFDNLDECGIAYLVALGNHDLEGNSYHRGAEQFSRFFGPDRWDAYRCVDRKNCDWESRRWFLGSGHPILAFSRNNLDGEPGPNFDEPGRHRAAVIRAPNGQRFLFIALDLAFDFPPQAHPSERDDALWVKRVMKDYKGVPTILVHHALLNSNGDFRPASYDSDSYDNTRAIWDELVEPFPQVLMTLNGHYLGDRENEWVMPTSSGVDVFSVFRNYQGEAYSYGDGGVEGEGDGWISVVVFDPDASEIRIRSYRVEDVDDDGTHDGQPEWPRFLDQDWNGRGGVTFPYVFYDTRPAHLDNCPLVANPDQIDTDGDGIGDACPRVPATPAPGLMAVIALLGMTGFGALRYRARAGLRD